MGIIVYLGWAAGLYRLGFPLDDAWIHQTYARNLVEHGEWAFTPGNPSAGSTSPLWSLLQAGGHVVGIRPVVWSALLGLGFLVLAGNMAARWWQVQTPGRTWHAGLVGLVLVWEWHLLWASLSGMEILAVSTVSMGALILLGRDQVPWFWVGTLIGLGVWLRPDSLSLLLPVGWVLLFKKDSWRGLLKDAVSLTVGLTALCLPYLIFNQLLSGTVWPTTFYAKQTEYQILTQAPLIRRLGAQFMQPLIGVGSLVVPGLFVVFFERIRDRSWARLAPFVWIAGFLSAYALRLPVTYQHGRYAMPVIPVVLVLGLVGIGRLLQPQSRDFLRRVLSRAWLLAAAVTTLVFAGLGARSFATDVAIIETEMVRTAKWVERNTESDALIAAHDIGALGYYGDRRILDLAGLVSPDVIGFMRDEAALADHLDQRGADYLMTFPGWYPQLVQMAERIYSTESEFSPLAGGENMTLYRWGR
ncbi:MAG: hypothetical protein R3191_06930 [Anaerolineales bacterium]|nr:hypothetical protein [Anaerolineales bacterium]